MGATRRLLALGVSLVLAAAVSGCAVPARVGAADSPDEAQPVVQATAAPEDAIAVRAAASVSAMSLREKAGAVVMGHLATVDPAALRDYMQRTGIGGFILMLSLIHI